MDDQVQALFSSKNKNGAKKQNLALKNGKMLRVFFLFLLLAVAVVVAAIVILLLLLLLLVLLLLVLLVVLLGVGGERGNIKE